MKILKKIICVVLIITLSATVTKSAMALNQRPILLGDVNRDSEITSLDADEVQRHILGIKETDKARADMNSDNQITIVDLAMMQRYILIGE